VAGELPPLEVAAILRWSPKRRHRVPRSRHPPGGAL